LLCGRGEILTFNPEKSRSGEVPRKNSTKKKGTERGGSVGSAKSEHALERKRGRAKKEKNTAPLENRQRKLDPNSRRELT